MPEKRCPHLANFHRLPITPHTQPPAVDFKHQPVGSHPTTFCREQEYYSFFDAHRLASISSRYARHIIRKNIGSALFVKQFRYERNGAQQVNQNTHIRRFWDFATNLRLKSDTFCHRPIFFFGNRIFSPQTPLSPPARPSAASLLPR